MPTAAEEQSETDANAKRHALEAKRVAKNTPELATAVDEKGVAHDDGTQVHADDRLNHLARFNLVWVSDGLVPNLVQSIRSIRNDLLQENFFAGIDGA